MMRRLMTGGLAITALLLAGHAQAQTCTSDDDCAEDQYCAMKDVPPCLPSQCDPDDADCTEEPSCPEPEGECADDGAGTTQECVEDTDCPDGFTCEAIGGTGCACPAGSDCTDCEPTTSYGCVPAPCSTDEDCGDGLVCVTETIPCDSTQPACPPGEECPEPEPCEEETESRCAPAWAAPCEVPADCGDGFDCVAEEICACSGGDTGTDGGTPTDPVPTPEGDGGEVPADGSDSDSGSGGRTPGSEPVPPEDEDEGSYEEDCVCEPSDEKSCRPEEIECASEEDCPAEWTCEEVAPPPTACAGTPEGDYQCEEPEQTDPESRCIPPYFDSWAGGSGGFDEQPAGEPRDSNDGTGSNPPVNEGGESGNLQGGGSGGGASGCQGGGLPTSLLPLALLALVAIARRRIA
ncbi:MAG: hypothetical protein ACQEXJ_18295 [Myxococcota bacterium]